MEKLRTRRTVCMSQLSRLEKQIENLKTKNLEEIEHYENKLDGIYKRLEEVQSELELNAGENNLSELLDYRFNFEDLNTKLALKLKSLKKLNNHVTALITKILPKTGELKFDTYNDELETFSNYSQRFDNFIKLNNIKNDEMKVRIFLNSLSPSTYEKLREFCFPKIPSDISYLQIQKILNENLEPCKSIWAKQHKFITRIQQENEPISEYSINLKFMSSKCKFLCECGRPFVNTVLRLQFIRGIKDSKIRSELLQNESLTFEELVDKAKLLELSNNKNETKEEKKVRKKQIRESVQKELINPPFNFYSSFRGNCYRCGSPIHKAYECELRYEICDFCLKIGHISKVCRSRIKELTETNFKESSDSQESDSD